MVGEQVIAHDVNPALLLATLPRRALTPTVFEVVVAGDLVGVGTVRRSQETPGHGVVLWRELARATCTHSL